MMRRTSLKPGTGLKRTPFVRIDRMEIGAVAQLRNVKPKSKKHTTAVERAHLASVAAMGCILCEHLEFGEKPAEVHHVRTRHGCSPQLEVPQECRSGG
jgi:hypothetical protein